MSRGPDIVDSVRFCVFPQWGGAVSRGLDSVDSVRFRVFPQWGGAVSRGPDSADTGRSASTPSWGDALLRGPDHAGSVRFTRGPARRRAGPTAWVTLDPRVLSRGTALIRLHGFGTLCVLRRAARCRTGPKALVPFAPHLLLREGRVRPDCCRDAVCNSALLLVGMERCHPGSTTQVPFIPHVIPHRAARRCVAQPDRTTPISVSFASASFCLLACVVSRGHDRAGSVLSASGPSLGWGR